jgi:DNA-directed RNA polymerase specialized sigma subunit
MESRRRTMRTQTTMAQIPDPSSFYASHKGLVMMLAGQWAARHGLDMSDLESVGNEVMWNCMRKWDPARAKFSTFLYRSLNSAFTNLLKKEAREPCSPMNYPVDIEDHMDRLETVLVPHDPLWLEDVATSITDDAKEVVRLLFDGDVGKVVSDNSYFLKRALKKTLKVEWDETRIARAFRSIAKAL